MLTKKFAEFIFRTEFHMLPEEVVAEAKRRVLDTTGAALAGAEAWEYRDAYLAACRKLGKGTMSAITCGKKEFSAAQTAMINSAFAHVIELDDGHKNAGVHCGAAIVMTALTLGEALGASGKEILTAIVIGYDLVYRLAANMAPDQIKKGFHPSGNDDTIGAMAVAGKLLHLNEDQLANGLGMAALYSAGLMEATVSGQQSKCIQVGNAAWNGIAAALYAQERIVGTLSAFEGEKGFFHAKAGNVNLEAVCRNLGTEFLIGETYSKLYPTCRHAQPAIEAVLELCEEHRLDSSNVKHIWVGTYQVAYDLTGKIICPADAGEAKFSIAYGIAIAMREGTFGIRHLREEYRKDKEILNLARLVETIVDAEAESLYPGRRGAKVRITMMDGSVHEKTCYDLKGSPEKPVVWQELEMKFHENACGVMKQSDTVKAIEEISLLDQKPNISVLMGLLNGELTAYRENTGFRSAF